MPARPRKRVRRKRAVENYSSSDSGSSSDDSTRPSSSKIQSPQPTIIKPPKSESSSSSSGSESDSSRSTSSSSSSSSGLSARPTAKRGRLAKKQQNKATAERDVPAATTNPVRRSPSPIPAGSPPAPLPSSYFELDFSIPELDKPPDFSLPPSFEVRPAPKHLSALQSASDQLAADEARFREWYMTTIIERFPNELDQLRSSAPVQSQFELLVAALASGADIFDDQTSGTGAPQPHSDKQLVLETLDRLESSSSRTEDSVEDGNTSDVAMNDG